MMIEIRHSYSFSQLGNRQNQEDNRCPDQDSIDGRQRYFAVCDGVGGNDYGEVASKTVCDTLDKELSRYELTENTFDDSDLSHVLNNVYDSLDRVSDSQSSDMGTTLALLVIHNGGAMLAHIGDSRIYQMRPSIGIVYRSEDHSLVNEMVKAEIITEEDAAHHPQRHVINRAISPATSGRERNAATVAHVKDIMENDVFLLCSDGVTDTIPDEELTEILLNRIPLKERMGRLARRCVDSDDNNTCIVVEISSAMMLPDDRQTTITQVSPQKSQSPSFLEKIMKWLK